MLTRRQLEMIYDVLESAQQELCTRECNEQESEFLNESIEILNAISKEVFHRIYIEKLLGSEKHELKKRIIKNAMIGDELHELGIYSQELESALHNKIEELFE
jgi:hypothetical protein